MGLIVVAVAVLVVVIVIKNLNAPSVGTINQKPPAQAEATDPYANPGPYIGKYISFTYPAQYKPVNAKLTGNYLEVAGFYGTNATGKSISVGVLKESISDDTGIKLRRSQPAKYSEQPRNQTGTVLFVSNTDGSETTAFVPHEGKVATISITAPAGWDLSGDMQTILGSIKWK